MLVEWGIRKWVAICMVYLFCMNGTVNVLLCAWTFTTRSIFSETYNQGPPSSPVGPRYRVSFNKWLQRIIQFLRSRSNAAYNIGYVDMMTSSNGNIFRITGHLCGEFTGPGEFPTQRPVTRNFDVFFDLRLNKRLSKQPWGWWFETLSWSLWRQRNGSPYNGTRT